MDTSKTLFRLNVLLIIGLVFALLTPNENLRVFVGVLAIVPVAMSSLFAVYHKKITVDLLATIALLVSIIKHEWTSVVFINLMITCARIFGIYTENKAKKSIQSLFKLRPTQVKIKQNDQLKMIHIKDIKLNDLVFIDAGERIPVDGIIVSGNASIDQSSLTGESIPVEKKIGDTVLSSTLNISGSLLVKVNKLGKDTTFEKLISLMERAQTDKNNIESLIDKFASRYILLTLVGAVLVYFITKNSAMVLSLLLVTCADDIAVAIPLAYWAAIARGAKQGIIIKGGNYLEALARCKMLIVDKTGTLTKGQIKVSHVVSFGVSKQSLIQLAAIAESVSDHPMARAIVNFAKKEKIKYLVPDKFNETPGRGMKVVFGNKKVIVGNLNYIKSLKINISDDQIGQIKLAEGEGHNIVVVVGNDIVLGFIALGDELRYGIKSAILKLKEIGIVRIVMLTGDNEKVASQVAKEIGIEEYHANMLPEDKLNFVKKNLNSKYKIAMVGDGVNDAAALAISDVGFAMGVIGSDSAIEAADIALMNDNFDKVAHTMGISKFIMKIVIQNFMIWGVVNIIGLVLVFGKLIGPTGAASYNFLSDFLPLINSVRVFGYRFH